MNKSEFELYMWTDSEGNVSVSPEIPKMGFMSGRGAYLYGDEEPYWLKIEQDVMREGKDGVYTLRNAVWVLKCSVEKVVTPQIGTEWVKR